MMFMGALSIECVMAARWQAFFDGLSEFLGNADRQFGIANQQYTEYVIERLQLFCRDVGILKDFLEHSQATQNSLELRQLPEKLGELQTSIRKILTEWENYFDSVLARSTEFSLAYRAEPVATGSTGRPRFQIQKEQLEYLSSLAFSWSSVIELLGVSRITIYRKREQYLERPRSSDGSQSLTPRAP